MLSKFDGLVEIGLILHDGKQETVEHIDEYPISVHSDLCSGPKKLTLQAPQPQSEANLELYSYRRDGSDVSAEAFEMSDISVTHFLEATRQYGPLYESNPQKPWSLLAALGRCYIVFFNCGKDGGCSRLHKHMQLMRMPEDSFAAFFDSESVEKPDLPFQWFYRRFEPSPTTHPHDVIFTNQWIIVIPRRRGHTNEEASVNAMGMLGAIIVAIHKEINNCVQFGLTLVERARSA
ncbi:hypothetical protein B0T10DRAFT_532507 [Thelonectria olida]|uniref:ATP adenylyltransferase C-terminal domain-containing protein n=1 Tax=Thelonectria olida TaxID=1576542 RepID=A0A9P9AKA4_9HYPO|nr:hypothetical protein B0T10DRAFT_532507 [Thelonectria olida]